MRLAASSQGPPNAEALKCWRHVTSAKGRAYPQVHVTETLYSGDSFPEWLSAGSSLKLNRCRRGRLVCWCLQCFTTRKCRSWRHSAWCGRFASLHSERIPIACHLCRRLGRRVERLRADGSCSAVRTTADDGHARRNPSTPQRPQSAPGYTCIWVQMNALRQVKHQIQMENSKAGLPARHRFALVDATGPVTTLAANWLPARTSLSLLHRGGLQVV